MNRSARYVFAAAALAAVSLVSACGSSGGSGSSSSAVPSSSAGSPSASSAVPPQVQANLDAAIPGTYTLPETSTKPTPGKKITVVVFGNQSLGGPWFSGAVKDAAAAAGWSVNVVDGKFSTDLYVSAIRQAVAEKVDGIVLFVIDCATVKSAAEEAKAAGIPIIYAEGYDCDSDGKGTATGYPVGLYNGLTEKGIDYTKFLEATGQLQADAIIAAQDGKANVLAVNYAETAATRSITDGYKAEIALCSGCTSRIFEGVYADWGPTLQSKISTELLKDPSINSIMGNFDDPVQSGIAAAAASSGRDIYITGDSGYPSMVELIRQGKADMTIGYDGALEAWGSVERLNRIFNGDTAMFNIGLGLQLIDAEHNLFPADQAQYVAPIDYVAAYKTAWGVS